jgi:hypothetical protein
MKRRIATAGLWVGLLTLCFSVASPAAFAATSGNTNTSNTSGAGQALEIAPPLLTLTANPGQTVKATLQLRDVAKTDLIVTNEVNDFVASGESGTPKILTDKDDANNPFSLKSWIVALPSFQLAPGKIQTLNVSINVPANASPGGHYGVIRFTGTPPKLEGTGVSLSASLGTLVLLTVNGNLKHKLSVEQFATTNGTNTKGIFESAPVNFEARLKNTGNVQEEPTGNIMVTDMFGKTVGGVNINVPPHNILPNSIRKFTAVMDKTVIGTKHLFGKYTAELNVSYGGGKQTVLTDRITFWVIPYKLIAAIIVILIAGFFGLRYGLRRYNQAIINRAQGGKKKK